MIVERNKSTLPTTAKQVAAELQKETGLVVPERTMRVVLSRMKFRFVKGKKRNYLAETLGTVAYRANYVQGKRTNRDNHNNPTIPEVYLDESYCNMHHTTGRTWLPEDCVRFTKSGKGKRVCIVGAGVLRRENGSLTGEWVRDSRKVWQSDLKRNRDGDDDYHGNFTANIFELWFGKLCCTLAADYGRCKIYMDGAAYHKRVLNPVPNTQSKKADIQSWLDIKRATYTPSATKAQLLALVNEIKPPKQYVPRQLAVSYGHEVYYTPPYLKDKITATTWIGAYRKAQKHENIYFERDDSVELASSDDEEGSDEEALPLDEYDALGM
jgi:hypothetical protein